MENTTGELEAFVKKKNFLPSIHNGARIILTYLQLQLLFQAINLP